MSLEALSQLASLREPILRKQIENAENNLKREASLIQQLALPPTLRRSSSASAQRVSTDWTKEVKAEERNCVRDRIRSSYTSKNFSKEQLIEICCHIEEELLFASAPSRLDYFKSGVNYDKRILQKCNELDISTRATIELSEEPPHKLCKTSPDQGTSEINQM